MNQNRTSPPSEVGEARITGAIRADFMKVWGLLGHSPTLADYLAKGKFDLQVIKKHFGSYENLRELAITFKGDDSFKAIPKKGLKKSEEEEAFKDYITLEILPWIGRYDKKREPKSHKLLITGSDFHDEFVDPFCLHVFMDTCKIRQPDYINLAGDVMDFYELSYFNKNPARIYQLQNQIDFVAENIFKPLREACPNAQIDYLIGNHEYRLMKFLMTNGQALSSLRCLGLARLLEVDKYKINLVATPPFEKMGDELFRNYKMYEDMYMVTHGTSVNTNHAMKELSRWGVSGCSGHVHHRQKAASMPVVAQSTVHLDVEYDWTSMGCMCKKTAGNEYIQDLIRWQQGFNIVHLFPEMKKHVNEYIECKDGLACVAGRLYKQGEVDGGKKG